MTRFAADPLPASSLCLVLASVASAATVAPTAARAQLAIIHAFGDLAAAGSCLIVRLAASEHAYGEVRPRLTQTCERWAFNGVNVLKRGTAGRWSVLFEGSSYRCPRPGIPRQVQHDLGVLSRVQRPDRVARAVHKPKCSQQTHSRGGGGGEPPPKIREGARPRKTDTSILRFAAPLDAREPGHALLPRVFALDPAIFDHEQQAIWRSSWLFAGVSAEAPNPGDFFRYEIGDNSIVVVRDEHGTLHALHAGGRHRGMPICPEVHGNARRWVCPYHQWSYALDGHLLGTGGMDAQPRWTRMAHRAAVAEIGGLAVGPEHTAVRVQRLVDADVLRGARLRLRTSPPSGSSPASKTGTSANATTPACGTPRLRQGHTPPRASTTCSHSSPGTRGELQRSARVA